MVEVSFLTWCSFRSAVQVQACALHNCHNSCTRFEYSFVDERCSSREVMVFVVSTWDGCRLLSAMQSSRHQCLQRGLARASRGRCVRHARHRARQRCIARQARAACGTARSCAAVLRCCGAGVQLGARGSTRYSTCGCVMMWLVHRLHLPGEGVSVLIFVALCGLTGHRPVGRF